MPDDLIPHRKWLELTALLTKPRSQLLIQLDRALERYEKFGGDDARQRVRQALDQWKASKGSGDAWKRTDRNRKAQAFEELTARLSGKGDTERGKLEVPRYMQPQLVHSRLGILYLFGHTKVKGDIFNVILEGGLTVAGSVLSYVGGGTEDGGWGFGTGGLGHTEAMEAGSIVGSVMIPGKELLNAGRDGISAAARIPPNVPATQQQTVRQKIEAFGREVMKWLEKFATNVLNTLKEKFGDVDLTIASLKNLLVVGLNLIKDAAGSGLSVGYWTGGALDMAKGVANTLDAAYTRFRAWQRKQGVAVLSGHPDTIVSSIEQAMDEDIGKGLWELLKGVANTATVAATWGAGMVVSVVLAVAEAIIKVIWRLVEIARMKRFFREAADHWQSRGRRHGFHYQPFAFGRWYKEYALKSPALAVLTLNSGICGDKMHFLKMFDDTAGMISEADFQRGTVFVDKLKGWGSRYLDSCGYDFYSDDEVVSSLLDFAKTHQSNRSVARDIVLKVLNA